MTDLQELMACPFCGGEAERIDFGPGSGDNEGGSCIACTRCQSSGPVEFGHKENFVSNWNRRSPAFAEMAKDRARLDWLEGGIDRIIYKTALKEEWCAQEVGIAAWYGKTPREAIDAAIAASGGSQECEQ